MSEDELEREFFRSEAQQIGERLLSKSGHFERKRLAVEYTKNIPLDLLRELSKNPLPSNGGAVRVPVLTMEQVAACCAFPDNGAITKAATLPAANRPEAKNDNRYFEDEE